MAMKVRYTVIDGEIISEVRNGVRRDYIPDPSGNTIALTDGTNLTDTWEYWPFGEVRTRTGTTATPFQFGGTLGYYRDSSSRTYVRARHYRPGQGRWQTVDPLWPTEMAYAYVKNRPIVSTDFSGMGGFFIGADGLYFDLINHLIIRVKKNWSDTLKECLSSNMTPCAKWGGGDPGEKLDNLLTGDGSTGGKVTIIWGGAFCDGKTCAYTWKVGTGDYHIHLCSDIVQNTKKCGSLLCVLMHELIHATGHTHQRDNSALFECVNMLPECSGWKSLHRGKQHVNIQ